ARRAAATADAGDAPRGSLSAAPAPTRFPLLDDRPDQRNRPVLLDELHSRVTPHGVEARLGDHCGEPTGGVLPNPLEAEAVAPGDLGGRAPHIPDVVPEHDQVAR